MNVCQLDFYIDSRATDHLINDGDYFHEYVNLRSSVKVVQAEDGQLTFATKLGNLRVVTNTKIKCEIKDVYFVEKLELIFLFTFKMDKSGLKTVFENGSVKVINASNNCILSGLVHGKFYKTEFKVENFVKANIVQINVDNIEL